LWIGGRAVAAHDAVREVTNPATGEVVRHCVRRSFDVDAAVDVARTAFPAWRAAPALRRARILMRCDLMQTHKSDLARLVSQEPGRLRSTSGSITRGIEVSNFRPASRTCSGEISATTSALTSTAFAAPADGRVRRNHAFLFPWCVWMLPVALACGNTFILKSSI
jgi:malonate-semialdehyde dehydrogenase (acetylating)/methylmalonate-semialdehyde dehydrogenase